jgi:hypothetical protein
MMEWIEKFFFVCLTSTGIRTRSFYEPPRARRRSRVALESAGWSFGYTAHVYCRYLGYTSYLLVRSTTVSDMAADFP